MTRGLACFALASAMAVPLSGGAEGLLAQVAANLDAVPVVRAEFAQSRELAALKRPLQTMGRMTYSRQHGVIWQIEQPYRMTYVLGKDSILEVAVDGSQRRRSFRETPGLAQVSRIFGSILRADSRALDQYFEAQPSGKPTRWQARLTPRQPEVRQALAAVLVRGGHFIEAIEIEEAGGDATRIEFRNSRGSDVLTESEARLFEGR